jgi:type I restriction enzyme S subunit
LTDALGIAVNAGILPHDILNRFDGGTDVHVFNLLGFGVLDEKGNLSRILELEDIEKDTSKIIERRRVSDRDSQSTKSEFKVITAKNIRMGYLNREPREYISKETFKEWMTRGFPEIGDLFFTTEAPLANICLNDIDEPFALAQRAICFQPYAEIDTRFLMFALMSDVMQRLIDKHATGMTAKGIKAAKLKPLPIPIPPLAEQRRIVAKIDTLIALCDRLEASLAATAAVRCRLLDALLAEALKPTEKCELVAAE